MRGTRQRWGVVVAGLLLAAFVGCSGGREKEDNAESVKVSYKLRARLTGHEESVMGVAISPDGKLAVSGGDKALHIWSIPEATELRKIPVIPAEEDAASTGPVAFFPDGKKVATVALRSSRERVRIF